MRREFIIGSVLAGLTLAVYWPAQHFSFVDFDDPVIVTQNSHVSGGLNWQSVRWALTTPVVANWHPVTTLSHELDCQLFGVTPGPQHMVNVVLHAANAVLLFLVLQLMTGAPWRSALVAAIFAVHPLRVESVAWISERKDVLSGFFFMLTLWAYGGFAREKGEGRSEKDATGSRPPSCHPPFAFYLLALFVFALGLMSKPMLVTIPFVLLLLDYWPLGRVIRQGGAMEKARPHPRLRRSSTRLASPPPRGGGESSPASLPHPPSIIHHPSSLVLLVLEKIPFMALSLIVSIITFVLQRNAGATGGLGLEERVENAVVSYARYLGKMVWPAKLGVIYPHPASRFYGPEGSLRMWEICAAALFLLAITVGCVWLARPERLRVGASERGEGGSLEGCSQPSDAPRSNARRGNVRAPYLITGWFWYLVMMLPVIGIVQVGEQAMADRYTYLPLIGVTICLVWGAWDLWSGYLGMSGIVRSADRWKVPGVIGCGVVAALAFTSLNQLAHWQNTITLFEHTIAVTGSNPSAEFGLGVGLEKAGQPDQALVHYRIAAAIDPKDKRFHYNIGQLLQKQEHWQEAADQYQIVLALNPKDLDSVLNLADALTHLARPEEAMRYYDEALQVEPASTEALNNLAWVLATSDDARLRDGARAVQLAERACELTGATNTVMVGTLAAAYAEASRFSEAVATAQKACELAAKSGEPQLRERNQELLQLYKEGKPARER